MSYTKIATKLIAVQASVSLVSCILQILVSIICIVLGFWIASLLLEPFVVIGITTVPPGLAYTNPDRRQ